jgi:hypothetical protein
LKTDYYFGESHLTNNKIKPRIVQSGPGGCDGIATYGTGVFLALPGLEEVRFWPNWNSSTFQTFNLPERVMNCVLKYDQLGQRLI